MLKRLLVAALALVPVQAVHAQTSGAVTNHAFVIGKGAGTTGYTSLLCGSAQLAVGQSAADPICRTLSGDVTLDAAGVTTIGADKVTNSMLAGSIAASKLIGTDIATVGTITSGTWNGTTIAVANGGTGATNASGARTNLGLAIGSNVQAWDADLDCYAALTGTGIVRRTGSGTCSAGTAVANSELATMASGTFKGNVSGGSAAPSDLTASQVLDAIGSTRGAILYRGASGWSLLAPGTSGYVLTSNGSGADPSYQDIGGGGGGLSDTDRRNSLLDRIYQSKSLGYPRRVINAWATGFKAATDTDRGINAGSSSNVDASQAATGGYVLPQRVAGTYTTQISESVSANNPGWTGYNVRQLLPAGSGGVSGKMIKVTLSPPATGSNTSIAAIYVGHPGGSLPNFSGNQVQLKFGGSSSVVLTAGGPTVTSDPVAYDYDHTKTLLGAFYISAGDAGSASPAASFVRYVKSGSDESSSTTVSGYGGGTSNVLFTVSKVETAPLVPTDMTLTTISQTTDASVSNVRALIEYDNVDAPTLNSDLTAEVTCDGGANWAAAALSSVTANSQGGRSVAETADTACTAGTSFAMRLKTANGKDVPTYGATVAAH